MVQSLARHKTDKTRVRTNLFGTEVEIPEVAERTLADLFITPPFSIFDAKQGYWMKRRRQWDALGFRSDLGRSNNLIHYSAKALKFARVADGATGVFEPVLCEIAYTWFCPAKGLILDPFAGGSVRGIVAAKCGYSYRGVDLRPEQVEENRKQAAQLGITDTQARWYQGDSRRFAKIVGPCEGDFIFSSPPYFYREQYSDLSNDLNNAAGYPQFLTGYQRCIEQALSLLRPNRFACFEVAEVRNHDGLMPNFVGDTIRCFQACGAQLYNHIIHAKPLGSRCITAGRMFRAGRKVAPTHENVLVFIKGDWKKAVAEITGHEP